ncbi:MAG TPA: two-component regulator propeller domain-containing protein, partial [Chitinophagaceae bacterium]|nr:two-component regulator propeller domain-containing protein [Chitinophagaceae bacterium]
MKKRKLSLLACCLVLLCKLEAQDFTYTNYDIQHGLAGSTVYCMLQDKQGFLWFGTETGVSRFDGTHFKNFTTVDGLPDNQVLQIFEDSKGRIWMSPFNKSVCYYYQGRIYNQQNDTVLRKIDLTGYVVNFAEDKNGTILLQQVSRLHLLKTSDEVVSISSYGHVDEVYFASAGSDAAGNFKVMESHRVLGFDGDKPVIRDSVVFPFMNYRFAVIKKDLFLWRSADKIIRISTDRVKKELNYDMDGSYKFSVIDDTTITINTPRGAIFYNILTSAKKHFLPNEPISTVMKDSEGNIWFCTLGHGIFMLNSPHIVNISLLHKKGGKLGAHSLMKFRDGWLAGADMVKLFMVTKDGSREVYGLQDFLPERVTVIVPEKDGRILIGTDSRLVKLNSAFRFLQTIEAVVIKAVHKVN